MAILGSDKNATYRGYYSIEEALTAIRTSTCLNYFITTLLKGRNVITT